MRANVPEAALLAPPGRLAERVAGLEDRVEIEHARTVPAAAVHLLAIPGGEPRIEPEGEEDDRRGVHRVHEPLGRLDAQRQRLLEQQRPACLGRRQGELRLHIGRNGERNRVDRGDQLVEVVKRAHPVLGRQRRRLRRVAAPDADERRVRVGGDPGRVGDVRPVAGPDQSEAQHRLDSTPRAAT